MGILLEEMFPEARMQMVNIIINKNGVSRKNEFKRAEEYAFFIMFGNSSPIEMETATYSPFLLDVNGDEDINEISGEAVRWERLLRGGSNSLRTDRPNLFYPIFIDEKKRIIKEIGHPIPLTDDWKLLPNRQGLRPFGH